MDIWNFRLGSWRPELDLGFDAAAAVVVVAIVFCFVSKTTRNNGVRLLPSCDLDTELTVTVARSVSLKVGFSCLLDTQ